MPERMLAIGGGVGPMAGTILHQKIIAQTPAHGDAEHLTVVHLSDPRVTDRTAFLLKNKEGKIENPAEGMFRVLRAARAAIKSLGGTKMIFGVPCNTFHAPVIFEKLSDLVQGELTGEPQVKLLHMIREVNLYIRENHPKVTKIGLMSTTGTRETRVYQQTMESEGVSILQVPENLQTEVHDSIYNPEWGIKALNPVTKKARENFLRFANLLREQGAELIILGCTEIPLALPEESLKGVPLLDPMFVLAQAMIREGKSIEP